MKKRQKIRLEDRVRHITKPELGEGTVWELRATGRVSVHWDKSMDAYAFNRMALMSSYNKHHYEAANLEVLAKRKP